MSGRARQATLDDLPLYATDEQIGAVILGPGRAKEWCSIALGLERKGLPTVDPIHRGRFVPAVRQWYYARHGVGQAPPEKIDGAEDWSPWKSRRQA